MEKILLGWSEMGRDLADQVYIIQTPLEARISHLVVLVLGVAICTIHQAGGDPAAQQPGQGSN